MLTGRPVDEDHLEATVLACYREGKQVQAQTLLTAQATANHICRAVGRFFQEYDVLLTPTVAQPPLPLGAINANDPDLDAKAWSARTFNFCPFTPLFNMTGQPAISLPLHRTAGNLPLGVQFAGRYGDETTLLQLARQLEQARALAINGAITETAITKPRRRAAPRRRSCASRNPGYLGSE